MSDLRAAARMIRKKTMSNKKNQFEKRTAVSEFRAQAEGPRKTISGYAATFNVRSVNFGSPREPVYEVIERGAFKKVLGDDVRALVNHQGGLQTLARTKSGTLRISEDDVGLRYEFDVPDTQAGRDIYEIIKRGDIDKSSFGFRVEPTGQRFEMFEENGVEVVVRTITEFSELIDVSPVTFPAYEDTIVEARGLNEFRAAREESALRNLKIQSEARARQIRLKELKS